MSIKSRNDDSYVANPQLDECDSMNYDVVTFDVRVKLIKLVCEQNYRINRAAQVLNVNQSTAKYIGKILKKMDKADTNYTESLKELEKLQQKFELYMRTEPAVKKKNQKRATRKEKRSQVKTQVTQSNLLTFSSKPKETMQSNSQSNEILPDLKCSNHVCFVPIMVNPFQFALWGTFINPLEQSFGS